MKKKDIIEEIEKDVLENKENVFELKGEDITSLPTDIELPVLT
jgi:hypothetical protein